jgi:hypothetical protein
MGLMNPGFFCGMLKWDTFVEDALILKYAPNSSPKAGFLKISL